MYEVIFYEDSHGYCPVETLLNELDKKAEKKDKNAKIQLKQIMFQLDLLSKIGTRCPIEYVEHIRGDIWQLRPGVNRILLFSWRNNKFVLLHFFRKNSNKTPEKEIKKAENEIADWVKRYGM